MIDLFGEAQAQVEQPAPAPADPWSPGVGDATGPLGMLLALLLALDRFGLLPRRGASGDDDKAAAAAVDQARALAEVKKDVEHLATRVTEDRAEHRYHRKEVAETLTELRVAVRSAIDDAST